MIIDDRKKKILSAVVENYIETAEPVGSRTIAKLGDVNLSPATIRNEMGDLEEMGLLESPHTSAGRVPSQQGYRLYVDTLMQKYNITSREVSQMKSAMDYKIKEMNEIIRHVSAVFSKHTSMPTVVALPDAKKGTIRSIKLVSIDETTVMIIVVTDTGIIKNKLLRLAKSVDEILLARVSAAINENLTGITMSEMNIANIVNIQNIVGDNYEILPSVLSLITDAINEIHENEIFVEGTANILSFPEYNDISKAKELLNFFDEKENLGDIAGAFPMQNDIKILIGNENQIPELNNCSMIMSSYSAGRNIVGTIGIIGPTRMDYSKIASKLEFLTKQLSTILMNEFGNVDENNAGQEQLELKE